MAVMSSSRDAGLAVPIFVSVERDDGARVKEELLWNLGGAEPTSPRRLSCQHARRAAQYARH